MVHLGEHDRRARRGDPPRESRTHRYPHPTLHRLFEPFRGGGDELVGLLVVEEDRGGVDREDLADALEQEPQQPVVHGEVGERHLRDRLDLADPLVGAFGGGARRAFGVVEPSLNDREGDPLTGALEQRQLVLPEAADGP